MYFFAITLNVIECTVLYFYSTIYLFSKLYVCCLVLKLLDLCSQYIMFSNYTTDLQSRLFCPFYYVCYLLLYYQLPLSYPSYHYFVIKQCLNKKNIVVSPRKDFIYFKRSYFKNINRRSSNCFIVCSFYVKGDIVTYIFVVSRS